MEASLKLIPITDLSRGKGCGGTWLSWQKGGPGYVILEWDTSGFAPDDSPMLGLIAYGPPVPPPFPYLVHLPEWNRKEFHYSPGATFHIVVTFGKDPGWCARIENVVVPPESAAEDAA